MLQLIELFAGIGSQTKALKKANIKHKVINICEWDIDAIIAYGAIHHNIKDDITLEEDEVYSYLKQYTFSSDGKKPYKDITRLKFDKARLLYLASKASNNVVSVVDAKGLDFKIDPAKPSMLTYSFPCQDLSNQGKQKGLYAGGASSMLWQVQRILNELKDIKNLPTNLLMENVPAICGPKNAEGFLIWQEHLSKLGYTNKVFNLRASDFGLPQNRDRTFMFSSLDETNPALHIVGGGGSNSVVRPSISEILLPKKDIEEKWWTPKYAKMLDKDLVFKDIRATKKGIKKIKIPEISTFSSEACGYSIDGVGPTLTANGAQSRIKLILPDKSMRLLNAQEAYRYMGFEDKDYLSVKSLGITDTKIIKQAGNSIPVPVLEYIFKKGVSND